MGTELGGGALAWLQQQMWPVQGWGGGAALCLAAEPCLGRGRPGLDAGTGLQLRVHHPQKVSGSPWALRLALSAPGSPSAPHPWGPASSQPGVRPP